MFNYKYQISKNWEWELRVELGGKNEIGEEGQVGLSSIVDIYYMSL